MMYFLRFIPILLLPIIAVCTYSEPPMPFIPTIEHSINSPVVRVVPVAPLARVAQSISVMPIVPSTPPPLGQIVFRPAPVGLIIVSPLKNNRPSVARGAPAKASSTSAKAPKGPKPKKSKGSAAGAKKAKSTKTTTTKSASVKIPKIKITTAPKTKLTKVYIVGH